MKIVRVETRTLAAYWADLFGDMSKVPHHLLHPSANFSGSNPPRLGQSSTLVFIETDEGITGVGESWGLPEPRVVASVIEHLLRPVLLDRDPLATEQLWEAMYRRLQNSYLRGTLLEAMSGIDMALWDIKGKKLGLPVFRLLGGPLRDRIETYASPVPFMPPAEAAEKALEFTRRGFRTIKVKIGDGLKQDMERIKAVREAVGGDVGIVTDANCGYKVPEAVQAGHRLAEYGVRWLEEPVAFEDKAGLAEVRRSVAIAVVAGENEHTALGVMDLLLRRAVDAVQVNLTRCGGITGALRIAHLAHPFSIPMSPHGVGSAVGIAATLHLAAAVPNFTIYEYNQLLNPLRDELLKEPFVFKDSCLGVPDGPGLGIELDRKVLERFSLREQ
ncbi:MAG TPA: mandelate racemase/muconate lactonizing enzyme family protein [Spirochaetia bacterium]|nr:mandelate racemase/muconate lactonizing enzyme family protein [Spirochaetia bacterium]